MTSNNNNIVVDVPEMKLPDCEQTPPKHRWIQSVSFKICSICGKVEG